MRIAILGAEESPYVQELLGAARKIDEIQHVSRVGFGEVMVRTQAPVPAGGVVAVDPLAEVDCVLVRTMPIGSLEQVVFRMDCLQRLADQGVQVINSPKSLETCIDKWLTLHRLEQEGLPVPPTIACQTREQALAAYEELGQDVVVKPLFGGEGRGMMRIQDGDMAWRVFSNLLYMRSVMYLQQFQPHEGYDVRILFLGNQHYAMRRYAKPSSWKTNVSQGAQVEAYEPTSVELELARRAAHAVRGTVVGVDLLPCRDGKTRILEVNAVPGWRGLKAATGVDLATEIIQFCCASKSHDGA